MDPRLRGDDECCRADNGQSRGDDEYFDGDDGYVAADGSNPRGVHAVNDIEAML